MGRTAINTAARSLLGALMAEAHTTRGRSATQHARAGLKHGAALAVGAKIYRDHGVVPEIGVCRWPCTLLGVARHECTCARPLTGRPPFL